MFLTEGFKDLSKTKKVILLVIFLLGASSLIILFSFALSKMLNSITPEVDFRFEQIAQISSLIIAATSFLFFLIFFIKLLYLREKWQTSDGDFKILATLGLFSLISLFLPEFALKISEIGNAKALQENIMNNPLFPKDKFELRKIAQNCSLIIAATSFFFFLLFFIKVLCLKRRGQTSDGDFKILAALGLLSLLPPFLPELALKVSEIGNMKVTQEDKESFRDQIRYTKALNSVNNPNLVKDGNFAALTFFLPILMEVLIEKDNKKKLGLLCEALKETGVPSPEQVRFYERSRRSPFIANTYLYFGLPMEDKEAKELFKRKDYGALDDFKNQRSALEKIVRTKCNNNIFEIKGLIQRLENCIEWLGNSNSSIEEKRIALNELISEFQEHEEVLKTVPSYFPIAAQFYIQLAKTYDGDGFSSLMDKAKVYFNKAIHEIPKPENFHSNFLYAEFLTLEKGETTAAIKFYKDSWNFAEEKADSLKSILEKVEKEYEAECFENKKNGCLEKEVIMKTIEIFLNQVKKKKMAGKNRGIYNAAINGNLQALNESNAYDFIINTFENSKNDPSYLDTKGTALIIHAMDQECPDRIKTIRVAKETLGSASIIAKSTNDRSTFNVISDKLRFLTSTDFGC